MTLLLWTRRRRGVASFYAPDPSVVAAPLDSISSTSFDPDIYMNLLVGKSPTLTNESPQLRISHCFLVQIWDLDRTGAHKVQLGVMLPLCCDSLWEIERRDDLREPILFPIWLLNWSLKPNKSNCIYAIYYCYLHGNNGTLTTWLHIHIKRWILANEYVRNS